MWYPGSTSLGTRVPVTLRDTSGVQPFVVPYIYLVWGIVFELDLRTVLLVPGSSTKGVLCQYNTSSYQYQATTANISYHRQRYAKYNDSKQAPGVSATFDALQLYVTFRCVMPLQSVKAGTAKLLLVTIWSARSSVTFTAMHCTGEQFKQI